MRIATSRRFTGRMPSSGMLHRVTLVRTDVTEERSAAIIRVTRIGELRTTLAITSNRSKLREMLCEKGIVRMEYYSILVTLMMEALHSSETSVLIIIVFSRPTSLHPVSQLKRKLVSVPPTHRLR
jgi:hypothetical protein